MYDEDMYGNLTNRNTMATAAIVFGVVSLFLCSNIGMVLPLGSLAILFAILSRTERKMQTKSMIGLACGFAALIASICITVVSFYYVLNDPEAMAAVEQYIQMYLGDTGFDLDALISQYQKGI